MTNETFEKVLAEIKKSEMTQEELATFKGAMQQSKNGMTKEQYDAILEALDKAQESTRPFTVVKDDTLAVVGDANDTKVNKYQYEITFTKPVFEDGNIVGEADETKTYKNVFITPRQQSRVTKMIVMLLPYFRKVDEDGNIVRYTPFEMAEIFATMDESIYDVMYDLVAFVLNVPDKDKEYMQLSSVIKACLQMFVDFPEAVNEAESFFA